MSKRVNATQVTSFKQAVTMQAFIMLKMNPNPALKPSPLHSAIENVRHVSFVNSLIIFIVVCEYDDCLSNILK